MSTGAMTRNEMVTMEPTLQMKIYPQNHPLEKNSRKQNKLKSRLRLDPSRALEPARKKIATIEAQRIMSVFEETIVKVELITLLPYIIANLERFRISLCSELSELMQHHLVVLNSFEEIKKVLEKQMKRNASIMKVQQATPTQDDPEGNQVLGQDIASSTRRLSNLSLNSQMESTITSFIMVALQINSSCKNIIRAFNANHSAMNMIKQVYPKRTKYPQEFVTYMHELRDIILNKLLTTPEEEKEKMEYLHEISRRERHTAALIEKLEAELKSAQDDKDEEIKKMNDVIRGLQADLRQVQKFSDDHIRRVAAEADKQKITDKKNSENRRLRIQNEIIQLQTQLQNLIREHRESEYELRKKKFKIETEVENWIQRFDQDMGERQDDYERIDEIYTVEKEQLHELEERFHVLETEHHHIIDERKIAQERREAALCELLRNVKASTTIQAFWRSFKVRKVLKTRKKKDGKKKQQK